MTTHLVWVPQGSLEFLGGAIEGLEIIEIPDDPANAPCVADVAVLVPPMPVGGRGGVALGNLLKRMPSLRLVQLLSAGVDGTTELIPAGVTLCSARGAHDVPVAEWVVGAILAGLKGFPGALENQRHGRWAPGPTGQLAGAGILFLGYGSIAHEVERRLAPFGPRFWRVARHAREGVLSMDALAHLLPQADVVVILLPLTDQTRGVVDAEFLGRMRHGALLVNAARGTLVNTAALLDALRTQHVRAVLDVTDPEPLPADHPLWQAPGVLITPHIAGYAPDWQVPTYALVRAQLECFARGEPLLDVVEEGY
jgi:phosphoglycerate dehydrogenase-like enzyme